MGKIKFKIGYLGVIALMAFGFEMCLIQELWVKIAVGIIDILAFLMNIQPEERKTIDGTLYMVPGEDKEHVALGLTMNTTPDQLFEKDVAVLEIVNKMGGNTNGINKK